MLETSMVREIDVLHDGRTHKASFYVDHGVIHARIGGHVLLAPLMDGDAAETVRALLRGHLLQASRKMRHAGSWAAQGMA